MINRSEITVYKSLSQVTITGFDGKHIPAVDPAGSANWLCSEYGMAPEGADETTAGILWTDYDGPGWTFDVLISTDEVDGFQFVCKENGYSVDRVIEITEPQVFGDGQGTVTILKHPDGWVLAN